MNPAGYLYNSPAGLQGEHGIGYNYILADNGLFVEAENQRLEATVQILAAGPNEEIRGLVPMKESLTLKHGLVPRYLWDRAWEILARHPFSERYLAITWESSCYELALPNQKVTSASVKYAHPRNVVVDIHSHGP